jgi:choline dehydrogenase
VRQTCGTTGRPGSSAATGTDAVSVLDETEGARRAHPPHANTNAPSILIRERCADFIDDDQTAVTRQR